MMPTRAALFIGMTMDTTRADLYQAVLEGVAFAIRDSFEVAKSLGIHIEASKICGGGAKSVLWRKIFANVLNIRLDLIESEERPWLWRCNPRSSCLWRICYCGGSCRKTCQSSGQRGT